MVGYQQTRVYRPPVKREFMNETPQDKPGPAKRGGKPTGGRPQRSGGGHGGRPHGGGHGGHHSAGGHGRGGTSDHGHRAGGKPGGKGAPKKKLLPAQIKQAKMMVEQSGIPFNA